ncbi:hypothetical protein IQ272_22625 [Chroococcidiopsidales cyanobacterium LEGE 13417]|nr:hypothetical protein [Chroococcidiopsidales cyanobacterium LEGE 13417]
MSLPKLNRQPIRPDKDKGVDAEIWYPDWRCFCCHDTGIVRPKLAQLVIPDYDYDQDLHPACYRCEAGSSYTHCEEYDQRFNRGICGELDRIERENWTATVKEKQQRILETRLLAQAMSMRSRDRTSAEEVEVQQRHEEACNVDPKKQEEMEQAELELMEQAGTGLEDECEEKAYHGEF